MTDNNEALVVIEQVKSLRLSSQLEAAKTLLDDNPSVVAHNFKASLELALIHAEMGEKEKAAQVFESLLHEHPNLPELHRYLSVYKRYTSKDDPQIKAMEDLLMEPSIMDVGKSSLHFALGKAYEDPKLYERTFKHYQSGNEIINQKTGFSIDTVKKNFDIIENNFNRAFFDRFAKAGLEDETPIFIIGMPRSATSLVEQVLSSHSHVYGAGELDLIWRIYTQDLKLTPQNFGPAFERLNDDSIKTAAQAYIAEIRKKAPEAKFITDKMPMNFRYVGLIKAMFPNARIIHCKRDPRDTCWSNFKCRFMNPLPYAYSFENIVGLYKEYQELMRHWHSVLPGQIFDFEYEEFIENQKPMTEKLLEFCGLDWEDACMEFHKTVRTVNTASSMQVKQPLYKGAVGYWKNYEPYLGKAFEGL